MRILRSPVWRFFPLCAATLLEIGLGSTVRAQFCGTSNPQVTVFDLAQDTACTGTGCTCSALPTWHCKTATVGDITYQVTGGGPSFNIEARATVTMPDNRLNNTMDSFAGWPNIEVFNAASPVANCEPNCGTSPGWLTVCGPLGGTITFDKAEVRLTISASCSSIPTLPNGGLYSFSVNRCPFFGGCRTEAPSPTIDFSPNKLAALLDCPIPPPQNCSEGEGGSGGAGKMAAIGAAASSCKDCVHAGGSSGCSQGIFGKGASCSPQGSGPGTSLRYYAKSVGSTGMPGAAAWKVRLGRNWSHDFAERIVIDPDVNHVWLLTRNGTFREFKKTGSGAGTFSFPLANNAPSDEYRQLVVTTDSTGGATSWQLKGLDGTVQSFHGNGTWNQTVDRNGNSWQAQYGDSADLTKLTGVTFPDGRQERFEYDAGTGKLLRIFEDGVPDDKGAIVTRQWTYAWSGDDLATIARPDGTTWEFLYNDPMQPGYLTRVNLIGTDGISRRIESVFEYDSSGNTTAMCRGEVACTGPSATNPVDKVTFAYTNPSLPTQTIVTHFLTNGGTPVTMPVTYTLERDSRSIKARVKAISGECGSCGLTPNTTFEYADAANPLQPTAMIDGNTNRTEYVYTALGRMISKTEAKATEFERTTSWTYGSANFPAFATQMSSPSSDDLAGHLRTTTSTINASNGNVELRSIDGFEGGAAFPLGIKDTDYTYNPQGGQVASVNPPGYGALDVTSFTYEGTQRGGLVLLTRTDPVVGTTSFGYDGWNRRTRVTDPNLVITDTDYDLLNRVTLVAQRALDSGEPDAADLETKYHYDCPSGTPADGSTPCRPFRDLRCVELPLGNGIEYLYDAAGRLVETRRKADCQPATQPLERTLYTLDVTGNRTLESLEHWNGSAWVPDSVTKSDYTKTCHVDKVTRGFGSAAESTTEFCYDNNGNLQQTWDANHPRGSFPTASMSYSYDALNRMKTATQPWGGAGGGMAITSYDYDPQDHLRLVTDANSNMTTYETGDRDLMTEESSPVFSGGTNFTTYSYDEHGNLAMKTDPRGVTVIQEHDPADRMTQMNPPGSDLDTTYFYDSPSVFFSKGRLTSISRPGSTIAYEYDRFGRMTKDGALAYGYDLNSNRTTIAYSPTVALCYGFDALDRPNTLKHTTSGGDPCTTGSSLVTSVGYLPSGPVTSLALGNGLTETRLFDARYYPERIQVPGGLDWDYTVDAVGNPTLVSDLLTPAGSRTYGYQDYQYFLTSSSGPWAGLDWTYDRIGNRLSEFQIGEPVPFTYSYLQNGTGGNTPKLTKIQPRPHGNGAGSITQSYDPAGNQTTHQIADQIAGPKGSGETSTFTYSAESKLSGIAEMPGSASTVFQYDGRGFLRDALLTYAQPGDFEHTEPVYSSSGQLFGRRRRSHRTFGTPQDDGTVSKITEDQTAHVFYFAGRPVAQLTTGATGPGSGLVYLTADHLGTPVLATNASGTTIWSGGFTPFGAPYQLMQPTLFLRLPGQWTDRSWEGLGGGGIYYNVHRWYAAGVGRYGQPDPLRVGNRDTIQYLAGAPTELLRGPREISYYEGVGSAPTRLIDPLGLFPGAGSYVANHLSACYRDLHQRRSAAQANRFPGVSNDFVRHCTISCESADGVCGPLLTRLAGFGNEAQGIIVDILNRQTGAFEFEDLAFNEQGFACARSRRGCSCEQCCRNAQPTFGLRVIEKARHAIVPLLFY